MIRVYVLSNNILFRAKDEWCDDSKFLPGWKSGHLTPHRYATGRTTQLCLITIHLIIGCFIALGIITRLLLFCQLLGNLH